MYEAKMLPDTRNDPHAIYFDLLIGLLFISALEEVKETYINK